MNPGGGKPEGGKPEGGKAVEAAAAAALPFSLLCSARALRAIRMRRASEEKRWPTADIGLEVGGPGLVCVDRELEVGNTGFSYSVLFLFSPS